MVLRDKHRAAEPQCTAMASDQPVKKKQRIDAPDLTENEENYEIFPNSLDGITESIDANAGSPDSGAPSEDAVDCIPSSLVNSIQHLSRYPNSQPSTSVVHNGIHNPHYPFLSPFPEYDSFASNSRLLAKDNNVSLEPESVLLEGFASFQEHLVQQCLCRLNRKSLRIPFSRRIDIAEWPPDKILMFLSNMQLLFDVYLKQNHKGTICSRLVDICDALVRNEFDWLGEVIDLADHRSQFVNFMAGRVVSSFLIVAKDNIDLTWLEKLIENFVFDKNTMNLITVRKINFSLDVIKRIVEWKDMDQHPLEDSAYINTANPVSTFSESGSSRADDASTSHSNETNLQSAFSNLHTTNNTSPALDVQITSVPCSSSTAGKIDTFKLHEPVLKFPVNQPIHCLDYSQNLTSHTAASPHRNDDNDDNESEISIVDNDSRVSEGDELEDGGSRSCMTITLTDSESFDTSPIKCLVIRCLEGHWPTLVSNVKQLLTRFLNIPGSENCILSCLSLWENIISVKANLSVVDTKPFYMDLQSFVELLRCTTLPSLIYTQLLSLFNEVLCYGSTLALQDSLPDETCSLAHSIVRFVKDFLLLNNIRLRHSRTGFGFIGLESPLISTYSFADCQSRQIGSSDSNRTTTDFNSSLIRSYRVGSTVGSETDKTMLQKMVLLVLKSVAVTVKEMRCDSSDSSIDDYNAIQEMQMVERSIWDVLKKLDVFLKNALDFLPDSPFTKILIHLFSEQDDYLIESMVCTLDIIVGIVYGNSVFPDLIPMLNPILTFIEFLKVVSHDSNVLLDYLVSNETCFLLYLLRFLKYVRRNWSKFVACHHELGAGSSDLERTMTVLTRLRLQISKLVARDLFPYNISPVLRLLENCESLYEGNELS